MLDFIIVSLCLAINAFFSAFEMAFVTVTKEEISELSEVKKAISLKIQKFKNKPERTLSVIQIGITLVGAIAAAVGGTGAVEDLQPIIMAKYGASPSIAEAISIVVVILPLTYFSVVLGELVPKTIALKNPKKVLLVGTNFLYFIDKFLSPIVSLLEISTNFLLKILKLNQVAEEDESLGQTVEIGNLPDYHQRFVQNLVGLKGKKTSSSMIPWNKVSFINYGESIEEIKEKISSTPHSRFPVIDGDVIVGILHKKDLARIQHDPLMPWEGVLRSAKLVNANDRVLESFLRMQESQNHLAVVVNNDAQPVGIVTIEDILEEVVGDINDNADYSMTKRILSNRSKIQFDKKTN